MQLKEFNILLDIKKYNKTEYIEVVQGDYGTNVLNIQLQNGLNNYSLEGTRVEIVFAKPDRTTVIQDNSNGVVVINESEGKIQCTLNTNTIASPGKVVAEVRVLSDIDDMLLTSTRFDFFVRKALITDDTIKSTNEWPLLKKLLEASKSEELRETEESIRQSNEEERIQNEQTREDNEEQRIVKETERINSENERIANEEIRIENENIRNTNENIRKSNEDARKSNELERIDNEDARQSNENIRISQEELRESNETIRQQNETIRQQNENKRESNEFIRVSNEEERIQNERNRVSAETDRVQAELDRQEGYNQAINDFNTQGQQAINDFNTQGQQAINDFVTETERVEAIYPTRLANVENDLAQHKLDYVSQRQQDQLKLAKVEKDINDYKQVMSQVNVNQEATQKASGYGIISLPKNAANGQVSSVELKGLTATNLVKNGDFRDGTEGWGNYSGSSQLSSNNNTLIVTGNVSNEAPSATSPFITINQNKKFIRCKVRVTNNQCNEIKIMVVRFNGITLAIDSIKNPEANKWYTLYGIFEYSDFIGGSDEFHRIIIRSFYDSPETANGKVMEIQEVFAIDLTAHGLESKTADELNKMFPYYFSSTKSTVSAIRARSVGKNILGGEKFAQSLIKAVGSSTHAYKTTVDNRNVLTLVGGGAVNQKTVFDKFKENTQYTVQVYAKKKEETNGGYLIFLYTDGTYSSILPKSTSWEKIVVTSDAGKTISDLRTTYSSGRTNYYDIDTFQIEEGTTATEYEPYKESVAYITAKDESGNILELRSLPNGTKDEVRVSENKLIKRIGEKTNVASGTVINYADMADNGTYYAWNDDGETETGVKGDTLGINATELIYQLAEPVEIPIEVSGNIVSYPSGTIYIERAVPDAGIYTDKMTVLHQDLPIKVLEKLSKIDFMTGLETELDVSDAVIAENKLSFTHPDLVDGDIVFFTYEYDRESTEGETEIEYYDSRYVIQDSVTGKFYKWKIAVANGTPTIELEEV